MYKHWVAGEPVLSNDLNEAVHIANAWHVTRSVPITDRGWALTNNKLRLVAQSNAFGSFHLYERPNIYLPFPWQITSTVSTPSISAAASIQRVTISGTEYILGCGNGAGAVYRYSAAGASETLMTQSGGTLTACSSMGWDAVNARLYTSEGTGSYKVWSLAGSTMTFVSTITLSVAITFDAGTTIISPTEIVKFTEASGITGYQSWNKTTGNLISTSVYHFSRGKSGMASDNENSKLHWYLANVDMNGSSFGYVLEPFIYT